MPLKDTQLYLQDYQDEAAEDPIVAGSDDEDNPMTNADRIRKRYEIGRAYLRGHMPFIQSAQLKGPFDRASGWVNPWRNMPNEFEKRNSNILVRNERRSWKATVEAVVAGSARSIQTFGSVPNNHHVPVTNDEPVRVISTSLGGDLVTCSRREEVSHTLGRDDASNSNILTHTTGERGQQERRRRLGKTGNIIEEGKQGKKRRAEALWLKGGRASKQSRMNPPHCSLQTPEMAFGPVFRNELSPLKPTKLANARKLQFCTPKCKRVSDYETNPVGWDRNIETRSPTSRPVIARHHQSSPLGSQFCQVSSEIWPTEGRHSIHQPESTNAKTNILKPAAKLEAPGPTDSNCLFRIIRADGLKFTSGSDPATSAARSRLESRESVTENLPVSDGENTLPVEMHRSGGEFGNCSSADTLNNSIAFESTINDKINKAKVVPKSNPVNGCLSTPSGGFQYQRIGRIANRNGTVAFPSDMRRSEKPRQCSPRIPNDEEKHPNRIRAFSDAESPVTPKSYFQRCEEHLKIGEESQDSGLSWVTIDSTADGQSSGILDLDAINDAMLSSSGIKVIDILNSTGYSEWRSPLTAQFIHSSRDEPKEVRNHNDNSLTTSTTRRLSTASTQTQASPPILSPVSPIIPFDEFATPVFEKNSPEDEFEGIVASEAEAEGLQTPSRSTSSPGRTQMASNARKLKQIKDSHDDVALQSPWAGDHTGFLTRLLTDEPSHRAECFRDRKHDSTIEMLLLHKLQDNSFDAYEQASDKYHRTLDDASNCPMASQFKVHPETIVTCGDVSAVSGTPGLLDAVTVNPWDSASTHTRTGKFKKKVSFGALQNERSEGSQDNKVPHPGETAPLPQESQLLNKSNNGFQRKLKGSRDIAYAQESNVRFPDAPKNERELQQSSPAISAMAAAFIAADKDTASNGRSASMANGEYDVQDKLGSRANFAEDQPPKTIRKSLLKSDTADDGRLSAQAATYQIEDHVQNGFHCGVDIDAVIEDMGEFLQGWDVEAEVCKVVGAKSGEDQVHRERSRDYLSNLSNR